MASEYFNIYANTNDDNSVTLKVFPKQYKGLTCHLEDYADPEEAFYKLKEACFRALEKDFEDRKPKVLKYIRKIPTAETVSPEGYTQPEGYGIMEEYGIMKEEDTKETMNYDECLACQ